jgi:hypothetical protein
MNANNAQNTIVVSSEAFARLEQHLNSPSEATPALRSLMQRERTDVSADLPGMNALDELSALDQSLGMFT